MFSIPATALLNVAVGVLRVLLLSFQSDVPYHFNDRILPQSEYDFIVVGAGTAGSVVAARLAEAGVSVLVLEAGGSALPETAVPGFMPLLVGSEADYRIKLVSQRNSQQAFANNASFLALGRGMGGGSSMNGMLYTKGDKRDFDNWAALGNEGWDYDSVLHYFKKSEDFRGYRTATTEQFHGRGGPIRVEGVQPPSRLTKAFLRAGQQMGYNIIDESGPSAIGFTPLHYAMRAGVRESASESFLRPIVRRQNLFVLTNALVKKILFDDRNRATGVLFTFKNKDVSVRAKKEVILCAGAILSPKLLMLSGVGPRNHLQHLKVPIVATSEGVGRNLQDHLSVLYLPFDVSAGVSFNSKNFADPNLLKQYFRNKTGVLSKPFGSSGAAFVSLGEGNPSAWPDTQISLVSISSAGVGYDVTQYTHDLTRETYDSLPTPGKGRGSIVMAPILLRPRSRGSVTLKSADPQQTPLVDYNFFSHPHDLKLLVKAIKFTVAISQTESMKALGTTFTPPPLYGCTHLRLESDQYWECVTRRLVVTFFHPVGTCKMAPPSDPLGVVSPTLKVRGVSQLRVADSSIMPEINAGNTMAAVLMIGEKAADLVKRDWGI